MTSNNSIQNIKSPLDQAPQPGRLSFRDAVRVLLFGFDVFISYSHRDGQPYAKRLERALEGSDTAVFRDETSIDAGENLSLVIKLALYRTRCLVVLGTSGALESRWIGREVEIFGSSGKEIIPIDIDGVQKQQGWFSADENLFVVDRSGQTGPSEQIVSTVLSKVGNMTTRRRARWTIRLTLLVLLGLLAGVIYTWRDAVAQTRRAEQATHLAGARMAVAQDDPLSAALILSEVSHPEIKGWWSDANTLLTKHLFPLAVFEGHDEVSSASFDPSGELVVSVGDGKARIWRAADARQLLVLGVDGARVTSAAFDGTGLRVVTSLDDGTARTWTVSDGTPLERFPHSSNQTLVSAVFDQSGDKLATVSLGTARVWRAEDAALIRELRVQERTTLTVAFDHPGERVVTASGMGGAWVWSAADTDMGTDERVHFNLHGSNEDVVAGGFEHFLKNSSVYSAQFSPDGKQVVTTGFDETVRIWSSSTGQQSLLLEVGFGHPPSHTDVASGEGTAINHEKPSQAQPSASLDGQDNDRAHVWVLDATFDISGEKIVAPLSDGTARIWSVFDGSYIELRHDKAVSSASFDPSGRRVVTASKDGTARLWDTQDGQEIACFEGHDRAVTSASFDSNGELIVTTGDDGTVRVWRAMGGKQVSELMWDRAGLEKEDRVINSRMTLTSFFSPIDPTIILDELRTITACLHVKERMRYLVESFEQANSRYVECEEAHGRVPHTTDERPFEAGPPQAWWSRWFQ